MKLRDTSVLEQCKLWKGCMLEMAHRYGGVDIAEIEQRIVQMDRCDDLTPDEKALLAALKQTVVNHKAEK